VSIQDRRPDGGRLVLVHPEDSGGPAAPWKHGPIPAGRKLLVQPGDRVRRGDALTAGEPWYDDLLRLRGIESVRGHLLDEMQAVYRGNGVRIDDRHFEVIIGLMTARWRIEEAGDSGLAVGEIVSWQELERVNLALANRVRITDADSPAGGTLLDEKQFKLLPRASAVSAVPPAATPLGITRAAMESDSFLSAASFQQAGKVLLEAALAGRTDPLSGLKENVMLGRLIPAGTGYRPPSRNGEAPRG
jgi:DNA-directed RNA polymerase subunit beta'